MMLDKPNWNGPERRSAIISKEFQKYNIDIAEWVQIRWK